MAAERESLRFCEPFLSPSADPEKAKAIAKRARADHAWVFNKDPRLLVRLGYMRRKTREGWRKLGVVNPHPDVIKR